MCGNSENRQRVTGSRTSTPSAFWSGFFGEQARKRSPKEREKMAKKGKIKGERESERCAPAHYCHSFNSKSPAAN